jgi:hypothetical protein
MVVQLLVELGFKTTSGLFMILGSWINKKLLNFLGLQRPEIRSVNEVSETESESMMKLCLVPADGDRREEAGEEDRFQMWTSCEDIVSSASQCRGWLMMSPV